MRRPGSICRRCVKGAGQVGFRLLGRLVSWVVGRSGVRGVEGVFGVSVDFLATGLRLSSDVQARHLVCVHPSRG